MLDNTVILYSTGCPKCAVLKQKLEKAHIQYAENTDLAEMQKIGLKAAPALVTDDGLLGFGDAVRWISGKFQKEQ